MLSTELYVIFLCQMLEIIRFDSIADHQHNASSGDLYHIQVKPSCLIVEYFWT